MGLLTHESASEKASEKLTMGFLRSTKRTPSADSTFGFSSGRGFASETRDEHSDRINEMLGNPALDPSLFEKVGQKSIRQKLTRPSLSYWQDAWIRLKKNKQALISLWVIIGLVAFTLIGPFLWTLDPAYQDLKRVSEAPGLSKSAVVQADLPPYEEVVLSEKEWPANPPAPESGGSQLPAPQSVELIGEPSTHGIRLKWTPVKGAASYVVYRSDAVSAEGSTLGAPIGEVEGGNKVSYEDTFNLEARSYFYSIVPKNGEESTFFASRQVEVPRSLSLEEAQLIKADAKLGDTLKVQAHPLGTDYLGRDMLARLMQGARVSLFIGFTAPFLAVLIGILIGGFSGYSGGRVDSWTMRFTDFVLALPFLLFMILFKIAFGTQPGESGIGPMLISLVLLSWTTAARLTRGQVLQLREAEFVQAARLLGAKSSTIILRHLLPNTVGVVLVTLTFQIPSTIFTEAFLSFIGMGVVPPTPSWGSMCNDGVQTF